MSFWLSDKPVAELERGATLRLGRLTYVYGFAIIGIIADII